jgi:hypothetical protein
MLRVFPSVPARIIHSGMQGKRNPEGPDALIALVRISGGRRLAIGSGGPGPEPGLKPSAIAHGGA